MIICCNGCGRDMSTSDKQYDPRKEYFCRRCVGTRGSHIQEQRGRHIAHFEMAIHEDDYDEESGPE